MCIKVLNGGLQLFAEIGITPLIAQILVRFLQQLQLLGHLNVAAFLRLSRFLLGCHELGERPFLLRKGTMLCN